jgi:tRNA threonylcarbamoyladenosine biosynthesis protein TsaE
MTYMQEVIKWQTDSVSVDDTEKLAAVTGNKLQGGEVIELISDLGGGKTAFVRGLAKGMGSLDHVASPTFTISRVYEAGKLSLHHFDFYRLNEPGIILNEIAELIGDPRVVIVIEWSDVIKHVLPTDRLTIEITTTGDTKRNIKFTCSLEMNYLIPEKQL